MLLQRLQLAQHRWLAVRTQGQRAQVFGLGPDALCGVPTAAVRSEVEHGPHRTGLLIDPQLLGEGKGALQGRMQCRAA